MTKLLEVRLLTKSFGNLIAVNVLSFDVEEGEIFGMVGANGAGKTTVFNLLMGDFKQDSGTITFMGKEISNCKTHERVNMGLSRTHQIPQPFELIPVIENIRIGGLPNSLRIVKQRSEENESSVTIAEKVGLKNDLMKFPNELSLAKTKKLELARALATNPKLLLVDELFGGISAAESAELVKLVQKLRETGVTIAIVDHNMRVLMDLVQRLVVIDFGEKLAEGEPGEIATNERVIEAYLGRPLSES